VAQILTNDTPAGAAPQRRRVHPHKFAMWLAMGSIAMMFAGLTSAYVVRKAQGSWRFFDMPDVFWVSTAAILLSSLTLWMALRAFRARQGRRYRTLMTATLLLAIIFCVGQVVGFRQLYSQPQPLVVVGPSGGQGEAELIANGTEKTAVVVAGNPSESFLFIITGLHLLHIAGGIVALLIVFLRAFRTRVKVYNSTGLEVVSAYWHFVDLLWIYLFVFFLANQ